MPELVKIERGKYSSYFQVARAFLTAASAAMTRNIDEALIYVEAAIVELEKLRTQLRKQRKAMLSKAGA